MCIVNHSYTLASTHALSLATIVQWTILHASVSKRLEVQYIPEKVKLCVTSSALCRVHGMQTRLPEEVSFGGADAHQDCIAYLLAVDMGCCETVSRLDPTSSHSNLSWCVSAMMLCDQSWCELD